MIETVRIVGARGRVGSALSARLGERAVADDSPDPDVVLLCVPDRAISEVVRETPLGPWVAHVSGATPLAALDPHARRFGLHPLQSFSKALGPEQLDGVWGAVTAETDDARAVGHELAMLLGLRPFDLEDTSRASYHAGAAMASNYLVTLRAAARSLLDAAGAPADALDPLIRGVMETGFELTGPIARGDWETVERHLAVIRAERPELEELYLVLAEATARVADREWPSDNLLLARQHGSVAAPERKLQSVTSARARPTGIAVARTIAEARNALSGRTGSVGLVPTMGSLHEGHVALLRAARAENETAVMSLFVNPAQFADGSDLARYPRDEERDLDIARSEGIDLVFAPTAEEVYPPGFETWVDVTELGSILEGEFRPGHFRGVATIVLKLFNVVRPTRAYFGQKDAQQAEVIRRMLHDLALEIELRVLPTVRDVDGLALSSRNALLSSEERTAALALPRALETRDREQALAQLRAADLDVDYVEIAEFDPRVLVGAVRVGSTRLIDNVILEEDET
jgi:pantoate--beta-alanine ligase